MESWKLKLQGNWNELKGKIKQQHAAYNEDEDKYEEGKEDEWLGKMQKSLGKSKEEVIAWIQKL